MTEVFASFLGLMFGSFLIQYAVCVGIFNYYACKIYHVEDQIPVGSLKRGRKALIAYSFRICFFPFYFNWWMKRFESSLSREIRGLGLQKYSKNC